MQFIIRKAIIDDLKTIQTLNHMLFTEDYKKGHDSVLNLTWPQTKAGQEYYQKSLTDPKKAVFIAEDDNKKPLGYVIGSAVDKFTYRSTATGELENMLVVKGSRRKGAGRKLIETLSRWMKDKGVKRIYVSAYAKNKDAASFYKACGFADWEVGLEKKL